MPVKKTGAKYIKETITQSKPKRESCLYTVYQVRVLKLISKLRKTSCTFISVSSGKDKTGETYLLEFFYFCIRGVSVVY